MRVGMLVVDVPSRAAQIEGRPVPFAAKEFDLLAALAEEPTRA
jgi:DNA-binding response OmpR family regulator